MQRARKSWPPSVAPGLEGREEEGQVASGVTLFLREDRTEDLLFWGQRSDHYSADTVTDCWERRWGLINVLVDRAPYGVAISDRLAALR